MSVPESGTPLVVSAENHCPICNRLLKNLYRTKTLYDVPVCKKCRNGFANRRQAAYIVDAVGFQVLMTLPLQYFALPWLLTTISAGNRAGMGVTYLLMGWLILPLLFCCKDGFGGQSPGKWLFGVRVVDGKTFEPISFLRSIQRNLPVLVPYLGVLIIAFTMLKGRRWGDRWAGTRVVWDKYSFKPPFDTRGLLCTTCGYNLTGNVSGICPECGTPITRRTEQAVV